MKKKFIITILLINLLINVNKAWGDASNFPFFYNFIQHIGWRANEHVSTTPSTNEISLVVMGENTATTAAELGNATTNLRRREIREDLAEALVERNIFINDNTYAAKWHTPNATLWFADATFRYAYRLMLLNRAPADLKNALAEFYTLINDHSYFEWRENTNNRANAMLWYAHTLRWLSKDLKEALAIFNRLINNSVYKEWRENLNNLANAIWGRAAVRVQIEGVTREDIEETINDYRTLMTDEAYAIWRADPDIRANFILDYAAALLQPIAVTQIIDSQPMILIVQRATPRELEQALDYCNALITDPAYKRW